MLSIELRAILRGLARTPLFTSTAVGTLGLAIGAHTAIFSVVQRVLLDPLPFDDPSRLVSVLHEAPGLDARGPVYQSPATYLTYREEGRAFEDVALWSRSTVAVTGVGAPEQVEAVRVTDGLLPILRVEPTLGRRFTAEDDRPGSPATVLLGHGYWTRKFGAEPSVVGETLMVNGVAHRILGVQPPGLRLRDREPALWLPFRLDPAEVFVGDFSYWGVGRLADGVGIEEAERDLARTIPLVVEKFPRGMTLENLQSMELAPSLAPLADEVVGDVGGVLWILFGSMGIVLVIACANVLNLFLARAEGRGREAALRQALGASRLRLLREHLLESGLVALGGAAVGVALAAVGVRILLVVGPGSLPRLHALRIDAGSVGFAVGLSIAAALVLGALPMRSTWASRKLGSQSGSSRGPRRARGALVVAQLALALTLLVGAGLMVRSFQSLMTVDPGFADPSNVLTLRIRVPESEVEAPAEVAATHERILRAIQTVPGIESVGLSSSITMDSWVSGDGLHVEDFPVAEDEMTRVHRFKWISEGYFETMRNPLRVGRGITWSDVHEARKVVVVTEDLASEYWGAPELAIGKRVRQAPDEPWREIVGVVGSVRDDGLGEPTTSTVFWPLVVEQFWDRECSPAGASATRSGRAECTSRGCSTSFDARCAASTRTSPSRACSPSRRSWSAPPHGRPSRSRSSASRQQLRRSSGRSASTASSPTSRPSARARSESGWRWAPGVPTCAGSCSATGLSSPQPGSGSGGYSPDGSPACSAPCSTASPRTIP